MKRLILALLLALTTLPAHAGGPVIEDAAETAPMVQNKHDKTALVLLGLALAVLIASGGGDTCNGGEQPEPETGGC